MNNKITAKQKAKLAALKKELAKLADELGADATPITDKQVVRLRSLLREVKAVMIEPTKRKKT
jgi:hypothetical protein